MCYLNEPRDGVDGLTVAPEAGGRRGPDTRDSREAAVEAGN